MEPIINIDRPKVSDAEIEKNKDFNALLDKFKQESIEKAKKDFRLKRLRKIAYSASIAGVAVICTVSYFQIKNQNKKHEESSTLSKKNEIHITESQKSSVVNPPVNGKNIAYTSYKVHSNKGATIQHPSSSKILIPKNSFVDHKGAIVKGEIEIKYREMQNSAEIICSGIPMTYDSAGISWHFESAGMFDIKGYQNNQPIFVKENSALTVELASEKYGSGFNQYFLDTSKGKWVYLRKDQIKKNATAIVKPNETVSNNTIELPKQVVDSLKAVAVSKTQTENPPVAPVKPRMASPNKSKIDLDVDLREFPELAAFKGVSWEVSESNKNFTPEFFNITWHDVKIGEGPDKGKNYILTMKYGKRIEKLLVSPVWDGPEYNMALKKYEEKFKAYQQALKERDEKTTMVLNELIEKQKEWEREQQARKAAEALTTSKPLNASLAAGVIRVFSVNQFGIYNSDCPKKLPGSVQVEAEFVSGEAVLHPSVVYVVANGNGQIYTIGYDAFNKFPLIQEGEYTVVMPLRNNIYCCPSDDYKKGKMKNGKVVFHFELINNQEALLEELKKRIRLT